MTLNYNTAANIAGPLYLNDNPFHNFPHGLGVCHAARTVMGETGDQISALGVSGLYHDIDHHGIKNSPTDEIRAAKITTQKLLLPHNCDRTYISDTKSYIAATDFNERSFLTHKNEKIIADSDLSYLGASYDIFLDGCIRYFIEDQKGREIPDDEIRYFFGEAQPMFYDYLLCVSGRKNSIFLTEEMERFAPNFLQNRSHLDEEIKNNPQEIINKFRQVENTQQVKDFRERMRRLGYI